MVKVKEDLTGMKFDRLTVIKQVEDYVSPKGKRRAQWLCECSCENKNQIIANSNSLKRKQVRSCGCLAIETRIQNGKNNKKYNTYDLSGDYGIGYDCNGREFYFDLEDYELIKEYRWCLDAKGYVVNSYHKNGKTHNIKLHRLVMGSPSEIYEIDHIHGSSTRHDNRKSNLRIVTKSQNQMNTKIRHDNVSGVKGVCWINNRNKWIAYIQANKKSIYLGYYDKFEDAVKARKNAEKKYFGEFNYTSEVVNNNHALKL